MIYSRTQRRVWSQLHSVRALPCALLAAILAPSALAWTPAHKTGRVAAESYVLSGEIPAPGQGMDHIDNAFDVVLDGAKNIYVVGQSHVAKMKNDGTLLLEFGKSGSGNGELSNASAIALDARGNMLVVDGFNDRVQMFSPRGEFIGAIGAHGSGDGQFDVPVGIAIDKTTGMIYVADQNNNRVEKFNSRGDFLLSIQRPNTEKGRPRWVALDGHGSLYVVDSLNFHVDKFSTAGRFLSSFGARGEGPNQFFSPEGIGVDAVGNIYVADGLGVKKFDKNGNFLTLIGGDVPSVKGIVVEADGTVYMTRNGKSCVSIFKPNH